MAVQGTAGKYNEKNLRLHVKSSTFFTFGTLHLQEFSQIFPPALFCCAIDNFMLTDEQRLVHLMSRQMAWKFMASERINLIKLENILYITFEQMKII